MANEIQELVETLVHDKAKVRVMDDYAIFCLPDQVEECELMLQALELTGLEATKNVGRGATKSTRSG